MFQSSLKKYVCMPMASVSLLVAVHSDNRLSGMYRDVPYVLYNIIFTLSKLPDDFILQASAASRWVNLPILSVSLQLSSNQIGPDTP